MAVNANEIRKGQAILHNNDVCVVLEVTHRTPGNLRAFVQGIIRSIKTGKSMDVRWTSYEKIETVTLNTRRRDFSYMTGDDYVFSDPENYEEVTVAAELVGEAKNYLVENGSVTVTSVGEKVVVVEVPASVVLTVTDAPEGLKLLMRRKMEKSMEGDFETDSMRFKATERYSFGWTDPRAIFGTAGL